MLEGTLGVRNGPATVAVVTETRSMPLWFAYWNAASSVRSLESA